MSKMAELDMDRQRVERLTDVVRPPSFAESARAGEPVAVDKLSTMDIAALRVSHQRTAKLEYALAEILAISRDNRITQIALRAIDATELI